MSTPPDAQPVPMILHCPMPDCGARHVDEGEFAIKIHHTHSCQRCGHTWRPAVVATVGVRFLPGFKSEKEPRDWSDLHKVQQLCDQVTGSSSATVAGLFALRLAVETSTLVKFTRQLAYDLDERQEDHEPQCGGCHRAGRYTADDDSVWCTLHYIRHLEGLVERATRYEFGNFVAEEITAAPQVWRVRTKDGYDTAQSVKELEMTEWQAIAEARMRSLGLA